ncbi:unnamed protein product [Lactuca saligna]|uniref:Uncharacterized protein n=1 Tax=Lactuca saligna TaxID=75948 RepID=A0AA35Z7M0_LACSI|nr:unnamed protein product [Lactuca saligna]
MVQKPHITHQGVLICEVPVPVSPLSKKRRDEDIAKCLSKKKKTKTRKLVIQDESFGDKVILEAPEITLTKEISYPENTIVIPPEDSIAKSFNEEVRTSEISTNISNMDVNVNMGEGDLNQEAPKSTHGTPVILPIDNVTSTIVSLPPYIIPNTSITSSHTFT